MVDYVALAEEFNKKIGGSLSDDQLLYYLFISPTDITAKNVDLPLENELIRIFLDSVSKPEKTQFIKWIRAFYRRVYDLEGAEGYNWFSVTVGDVRQYSSLVEEIDMIGPKGAEFIKIAFAKKKIKQGA